MTEHIKHCPCCGKTAEIEYEEQEFPSKENWVHVVCTDCGCNSGWYMFEEHAIRAWNKRVGS